MPVLQSWTPSNVTVLGDAIHNMTPMAGLGANTALRDASVLRRKLIAAASSGTVGAIASYEDEMREYANKAVGMSVSNAQNGVSSHRVKRTAFRTVLRASTLMESLGMVAGR